MDILIPPPRVAASAGPHGGRGNAGLANGWSRGGRVFDIADVWPSSYSSNTNEILWGAKVGARLPQVTCVIRLTSYECGMDQPTFTPVQQIVESSGTLFFSFQDLDSTKPAGSVKLRIETIAHYLAQHSKRIMQHKLAQHAAPYPLRKQNA